MASNALLSPHSLIQTYFLGILITISFVFELQIQTYQLFVYFFFPRGDTRKKDPLREKHSFDFSDEKQATTDTGRLSLNLLPFLLMTWHVLTGHKEIQRVAISVCLCCSHTFRINDPLMLGELFITPQTSAAQHTGGLQHQHPEITSEF